MTATVIITGAASGIGRATARLFAENGYTVGIIDKQEEPREGGTPTHELIEQEGGDAFFIEANVRRRGEVDEAFDAIEDRIEEFEVLINNAGFAETVSIGDMRDHLWHKIMEVNVDGVYYCTQAALSGLGTDGAIVNISSRVGKEGVADLSAYAAAKHAVLGFTESISKELDDIRVNAVCPRRTKTAMTGFEGDPPEKVAETIYAVSQADYTGRAIDVGDDG